jgi:hypothetical protein
MNLRCGARKAALLGNREKDAQRSDVHKPSLYFGKYYHFDF